MQSNPLTDHAYDGIQEFDNPLPGWWKWMFIGSIVFSVFYAMYFHIGAPGRSVADGYDADMYAMMQKQFKLIGDLKPDADTILTYTINPNWLKVGKSVYKANCMTCHGREGEGKVGPNLTDDFYKNVTKIEDIARVINKGAGNGAMPAWSKRIHPNEVVLVSAYVATMRGKKPAGEVKGPDGNQIAPWPAPPIEAAVDKKAAAKE